jgi:hypothetical protein
MSADNLHKILEPYLAATVLLILVLCATAVLLVWHGRQASRRGPAAKREEERQGGLF